MDAPPRRTRRHPFGTLKCRAGYRHFLVRGFDKVRGEWSLMALCYNFTRVLNIVGLDRLIAYLAEGAGKSPFLRGGRSRPVPVYYGRSACGRVRSCRRSSRPGP